MDQYFIRAAAFTAFSSIIGYLLAAYRKSLAQRRLDEERAALDRWADDGGRNLEAAPRPTSADTSEYARNGLHRSITVR